MIRKILFVLCLYKTSKRMAALLIKMQRSRAKRNQLMLMACHYSKVVQTSTTDLVISFGYSLPLREMTLRMMFPSLISEQWHQDQYPSPMYVGFQRCVGQGMKYGHLVATWESSDTQRRLTSLLGAYANIWMESQQHREKSKCQKETLIPMNKDGYHLPMLGHYFPKSRRP